MDAPLAAALEAVAARLHAAGVPFLLGGSGLLDALGLDVAVRDVDLMLRAEDRAAFEAAAGEWLVAVTTEPGPMMRSAWRATLDVDGVEVEGLGGLAMLHGGSDGDAAVPGRRLAARWGRSRCRWRPRTCGGRCTAPTSPSGPPCWSRWWTPAAILAELNPGARCR